MRRIIPYWFVRRILRWLNVFFGQQCSGKRRNGYALEWCRYYAFHDGPCINNRLEEFNIEPSKE